MVPPDLVMAIVFYILISNCYINTVSLLSNLPDSLILNDLALWVWGEKGSYNIFFYFFYTTIKNNFIWSGLVPALLPQVLMKVEKNLIAKIFLQFLNMTFVVMMASLCEFIYLFTVDSRHLFVIKVITCVLLF